MNQKPRVAVASGKTREEAITKAISHVKEDILAKINGRTMIKPNFLSSVKRLASTQSGAVRPLLEFLRDNGVDMQSVFIAEGASRSTSQATENFGYHTLENDFGIETIDLNRDRYSRSFEIVTETHGTHSIEYADIAAEADTVISVAVAKTHDAAVVTLSLKNMMGCLKRMKRPRMHGIQLGHFFECVGEKLWDVIENHSWIIKFVAWFAFRFVALLRWYEKIAHKGASHGLRSQVYAISENLARMGAVLMPDISIIDAFDIMEGDGPGGGTLKRMGCAVAGTDPVACDAVMASMMGFDPLSVGYLFLADKRGLGVANLDNIETVGENPSILRSHCTPHSNYPVQMKWQEGMNG